MKDAGKCSRPQNTRLLITLFFPWPQTRTPSQAELHPRRRCRILRQPNCNEWQGGPAITPKAITIAYETPLRQMCRRLRRRPGLRRDHRAITPARPATTNPRKMNEGRKTPRRATRKSLADCLLLPPTPMRQTDIPHRHRRQ